MRRSLRGDAVYYSVIYTPGASSNAWSMCLGSQQIFPDGDRDFEESPCSLNFSNEVWKGVPGTGKEGGELFSFISTFFAMLYLSCKQT